VPADVLVTLTRGSLVESQHRGAYCVVEDGKVVRARGDLDTPVFLRSAAKPVQALAVVESGAPDRFHLTEEELALVVGSHDGSPRHAELAAGMLARGGATPELLHCGGHIPLSREVYEDYVRRGHVWGRLEDNCSGKHAGMILAMTLWGEDPARYAERDSRIQRENLANLALLSGVAPERIGIGTDGCGVPSFAVPLHAAALALQRFATPDELPEAKAAAATRIADAVAKHPEMIAGPRRFDTKVSRASGGAILAKMGAEGVQVVGVRGRRLAIAVKIDDGARRALHALMGELLCDLGLLDLPEYRDKTILSREGNPVGEYRVAL